MNMITKIRFSIMLAIGLFKTKRGKLANRMEIDNSGNVIKWGYNPNIKHVDDVNKIYKQNKKLVDDYSKAEK